jgi:hypothetical protein
MLPIREEHENGIGNSINRKSHRKNHIMTTQQIAEQAKKQGRVWLCGEMEIPYGLTACQAFNKLKVIAENCGYLVSWAYSVGTAIRIEGADIVGYYILDWMSPTNPGPMKIEHWTAETAFTF